MHLSCAKCQSLQTFSGEPLRCDACGTPLNTAAKTSHWDSSKKMFDQLVVWLVCAAGGIWAIVYFLTPEKERLADKYHVQQSAVIIDAKPYGCDFNDAPLGDKHCHYQRHEDAVRACPTCPVTGVYVWWEKVNE
jgi:hypothetical protein